MITKYETKRKGRKNKDRRTAQSGRGGGAKQGGVSCQKMQGSGTSPLLCSCLCGDAFEGSAFGAAALFPRHGSALKARTTAPTPGRASKKKGNARVRKAERGREGHTRAQCSAELELRRAAGDTSQTHARQGAGGLREGQI